MKFWYYPRKNWQAILLYPLSRIYRRFAIRKYQKDLVYASSDPLALSLTVPVIVVGNITVGGTGKTPMVRFLINYLNAMGFKVGVISRGYGGDYEGLVHLTADSLASQVGDEMAMQYAYCQRQGLDVELIVCRERLLAALKCQELGCDFIISDDGMQHYRLPRHLEIAVIGPQGLGNCCFIPAGPLREDEKRLRSVDFRINNSKESHLAGYRMHNHNFALMPVHLINKAQDIALREYVVTSESTNQQSTTKQTINLQELCNKWLAFLEKTLAVSLFDTTSIFEKEKLLSLTKSNQILLKQEVTNESPANSVKIDNLDSTNNNANFITQQEFVQLWTKFPLTTETIHNITLSQKYLTRDDGTIQPSLSVYDEAFREINNTFLESHLTPEQATTEQVKSEQAQHFLNFLNRQFCLQTESYHQFLKKSLNNLTSNHLPIEVFVQALSQQSDRDATADVTNQANSNLTNTVIKSQSPKSESLKVVALSAIGYPEGFFTGLEGLGFTLVAKISYPDHHSFKQEDIDKIYQDNPELLNYPLLVTEKDAIKLKDLALPLHSYFLEREGLFLEHPRWLDLLKDRIIDIYSQSRG